MSDAGLLTLLAFAGLAGFLGGLIAAAVAWLWLVRYRPRFVQDRPVQLDVVAQPVTVPIRFTMPQLPPLVVPVEIAPARTIHELARRVLAEVPDLGARPLSRILQCSSSTAHTITTAFAAERGNQTPPDAKTTA